MRRLAYIKLTQRGPSQGYVYYLTITDRHDVHLTNNGLEPLALTYLTHGDGAAELQFSLENVDTEEEAITVLRAMLPRWKSGPLAGTPMYNVEVFDTRKHLPDDDLGDGADGDA